MKTNHTFYFLLILAGAVLMASDDRLLRREYAYSLGIIMLMFGIYRTSKSWNRKEVNHGDDQEKNG
jgi:disulfide bond formation protein DsbB